MGSAGLGQSACTGGLPRPRCHPGASGVARWNAEGESPSPGPVASPPPALSNWKRFLSPGSAKGLADPPRGSPGKGPRPLAVESSVGVTKLHGWDQGGGWPARAPGDHLHRDLPPGHLRPRAEVEVPGDPRPCRRHRHEGPRDSERGPAKPRRPLARRGPTPTRSRSSPLTARLVRPTGDPSNDHLDVASIITIGMSRGPVLTKRQAGESFLDSVERHRAEIRSSLPNGDRLMTTWQVPGGQEVVTTVRRDGESDEAVRDRHLSAFWLR